jgi:hypothetical protein
MGIPGRDGVLSFAANLRVIHEPWSLYLENFDDRTYNSNQDRIDRVAA